MEDANYWKNEAERQKARADLEEKRKNGWILWTALLGIFAFIVISPYIDSVIGMNVDQIGWLFSGGIILMVAFVVIMGTVNYFRKKRE